jgi:hypothetical protein
MIVSLDTPTEGRAGMIVTMQVGDSVAELGSSGVTFTIYDNQQSLVGRLRVGKATVEWAPKNAKMGAKGKAKQVGLERVIADYLEKLK